MTLKLNGSFLKSNKCLGLVLLVVAMLVSLGVFLNQGPKPAASDQLVKSKPAEAYRNYGINYFADCLGKNQLTRSLDPVQYTFQDLPFYRQYPYFNYYNSPQIIGCGRRRAPCDTRNAIPNVLDPIDVSNRNIAPITVRVDDNLDMKLQKVGAIYKIFGNENQVFPLYGRSLYYNDNKWEYFTRMGPTGEFLRVLTHRQYEELGNNDEVEVEGRCGKYRVSIYDRYLPQYVPFI